MKNTQIKPAEEESTSVRLDKWLWAARFFKTRTLSQDNIELGRVRMNGVRLKASKDIRVGDQLEIIRGEERFVVVVKALSSKRGSATVAQTLYEETPESLEARTRIKKTADLCRCPEAIITDVLPSATAAKFANSWRNLILRKTFSRIAKFCAFAGRLFKTFSCHKNQASESQSNQRLCTICALSQSAAAALFAAFFVKPAGNLRCEVS